MSDSPKPGSVTEATTQEPDAQSNTEPDAAAPGAAAPGATAPDATAPDASMSLPTPSKGSKGLSVLAILLSLLALGGTAYTWYDNNVMRAREESKLAVGVTEIGGQVARLGDSISRLQNEQRTVVTQAELNTRIVETNSAVDLRLRDIKDGQEALTSAIEKINSDMQTGVNSYVVDEVSQLLKLANNNALFAGDAGMAIKALELADLQLKEMADPRFSVVRRKINEEIGVLNNVEQVDIESLTAKLQSLAERVPSLKLENERPVVETVVLESQANDGEDPTFTDNLKEFWVDLVNFAEVQRIDQAPKPLLTPEHRYFLNQNLQLQLAKAELGALQQRSAVYTQSLATALTWLNDYFDMRDESVQAIVEEITQLQSQPITVELPPVSESYSLLQSIKGGQ